MKILLSYSYHHFDPDKPLKRQPLRNTSAGILARTFYDALSEMGEVTYTDAQRYKEHLGKEFDLFVGIASHFNDILKAGEIKIKKSVYVAVNMHPKERNRLLNSSAKESNLPNTAFSKNDIIDPQPFIESLEMADFILCAGNIATLNSYIKHGVPTHKIKLFNYGLLEAPQKTKKSAKGQKRYLYAASEIGLRKGFDILHETIVADAPTWKKVQLNIVGPVTTDYHQNKLNALKELLGANLTYYAWLEPDSSQYKKLLQNSDFFLFPSLEEGQAGTAVDAVAYGTIPIVSPNTGLDFSPLGNLMISGSNRAAHNISIVAKSTNLDKQQILVLQTQTLNYYLEYHSNFKANIIASLRDVAQGSIYPKVSVILPVFNKELTVLGLIDNLNQAICTYPSAELRVILDGCTDKTEGIVRKFYKKKLPYPVEIEKTDNIFEVRSNNLGMKKATGKYCVIIQDDNYIYEKGFLFEAVNFLEKNRTAAVLGCLAGVNFYPLGTKDLKGPGQIAMTENEVYWRQDANANPELKNRIFQVDACMRGPLIIRKSFLEEHGYLDEVYAPLYADDMDLCMRVASVGYKVYCVLMDVENKSFTMAQADPEKSKMFNEIMERNAKTFYSRWTPSVEKNYTWINRIKLWSNPEPQRSGLLSRLMSGRHEKRV